MDKLRSLLAAKKKQAQEEFAGKKFVKRSEVEDLRLKRLREEEERELEEKEARKRQKLEAERASLLRSVSSSGRSVEEDVLSRDEVIRRLRLLGEPATLFAEEDDARLARLRKAQEELHLEDEHLGGQQENFILALQKEEKANKGRPLSAKTGGASTDRPGSATVVKETGQPAGQANQQAADQAAGTAGEEEPVDETMLAFQRAAQALKEKREEASMAVEDKIRKHLQRWLDRWEQDLESRPESTKSSASGYQATVTFKQTVTYLKPLLKQLQHHDVIPEMKAGLWMMVQAMSDRNYLHAYDIYMRLAVGNSPWPIGVTSVGIHERSAREKISHVMNAAHIMNDEATRKYLQALKRLITFLQRAFPTDPSRCVDFDGFRDTGRGAAGGGSDKRSLLEAERKGETWKQLGLPAAPHFLEKDGSVKVPPRWKNLVSHSEVFQQMDREEGKPPRTPPRTPTPPPPQVPSAKA